MNVLIGDVYIYNGVKNHECFGGQMVVYLRFGNCSH